MQGAKALAAVFAKEKSAGLFYQGADGKYVPVEDPDTPKATAAPLVVNTDEKKVADEKTVSILGNGAIGSVMRMMMGKGKGSKKGSKKMGPKSVYKFNTAIRVMTSGSSNTFYNVVDQLNPNGTGVTEAVGLAALFDEARCVAVTAHLKISGVIAASPNTAAWAVVYDSANAGAYSSVIGALISAQHIGPIAINNSPNSGSAFVETKTGYQKFHFKVPPNMPTAGSGVASESVGSNWFSTQDVNANIGFLKWAVDATSSVTYTVDAMIVYHMEYRMRT